MGVSCIAGWFFTSWAIRESAAILTVNCERHFSLPDQYPSCSCFSGAKWLTNLSPTLLPIYFPHLLRQCWPQVPCIFIFFYTDLSISMWISLFLIHRASSEFDIQFTLLPRWTNAASISPCSFSVFHTAFLQVCLALALHNYCSHILIPVLTFYPAWRLVCNQHM